MKKIAMIAGLVFGIGSLVWAIIFSQGENVGFGPGVWRWLIFSAVVVIASGLMGKWTKIMGAVVVLVGILQIVWVNPAPWYVGVLFIVAGALAFIPEKSANQTPTPPAPTN